MIWTNRAPITDRSYMMMYQVYGGPSKNFTDSINVMFFTKREELEREYKSFVDINKVKKDRQIICIMHIKDSEQIYEFELEEIINENCL